MPIALMPLAYRPTETAAALLARLGARATKARVRVLAELLGAHEALSHHDLERRLSNRHNVDRVTLYRVLDWLTEQGLAHKVAADDRIWRFAAAPSATSDAGRAHAHFQCSDCGRVICLNRTRLPAIHLPAGFRRRDVEVTVKGLCAACAH